MKRRRRRDILRVQLVRIFELLADAGVISHRSVLDFALLNFEIIREHIFSLMKPNRKTPWQPNYPVCITCKHLPESKLHPRN